MKFGGAFLSSKQHYLKTIPDLWKPITMLVSDLDDFESIKKQLEGMKLNFPLIVKPDMGERGKNVEKLDSLNELKTYLSTINQSVLIQEYIDYPIELGILFYWDTNRAPQISSIGTKDFCKLIGDGTRTLKTLVNANHRIAHRKSILENRFKTQWNQIIPKGEAVLVEPIGNHNRGTTFLDARHHYSKEMLEWVVSCVQHLPGFDYGRVDLKIENWNSFKTKTGIKILEINGVNSEPIHIYDPNFSIWNAYKAIFKHMHIIYQLSRQKLNNQSQTLTLFEFISGARMVLNEKRASQISYT
jgi:hypothetical protein|tara:strand:+ start:2008 stop:2907 length:900 start_codon:yes stop_codon:yes gene_type:complete